MLMQGDMFDPLDLPVFLIRVLGDFDMDEYQGPHNNLIWMYRSFTSFIVELLNPCMNDTGGKLMGVWVSQAVKQHMKGSSPIEASDVKIEAEFPALYDFLTCNVGEAGKPRQVGSLTLFARTGSWHSCLKDRQTKRTWWGEGDTVESALKALENALQGRQ